MTNAHRVLVDQVVAELRCSPGVRAILLAGSLARGTARRDSDVDILVVADDAVPRRDDYPMPVDLLVRTADGWRQRFQPSGVGDESWGYAFLDAVILHDPHGIAAGLVADARRMHAEYRTPPAIKAHYRQFWQHVRPKMVATLRGGDPVEIGWSAAVMANELLRTAWAANDLPNPSLDLGTVQRHLDDLTQPADAPGRVRTLLSAPPAESLRLQLALLDDLLVRL
ncbi:nucleotidyltransferase domain-containing protein [Fodinicola acaciae]|uniref:nucleotidyltransferase domain-containing protein n=1 Tax=Fodinicola acaciae TaxID=2681555 RepID=UPI0013D677C1|nr:nucleotidyltransferase domain-containing protein [Fodinicola acaciae]